MLFVDLNSFALTGTMVYSQICTWLEDFLEPPEELLDVWDLTEWLEESEIIEVFTETVIPAFKNKRSRDDSVDILHALLWEYYLFRRSQALCSIVYSDSEIARVKALSSCTQHSVEWHLEKNNLLTASEFSSVLNSGRVALLRSKTYPVDFSVQTVVLTRDKRIQASSWGNRYEPVVRAIYEKVTGSTVFSGIGRVRHSILTQLAASPDGLIVSGPKIGSLIEIKAPVSRDLEEDTVPYEYYCQMQVQMEVLDINSVDYCECRLVAIESWAIKLSGPPFIGAVAVVGQLENSSTWSYVYSPLFPNTEEGRLDLLKWMPEGNCLEKQTWGIQDWQIITVPRNKRWWANIGLPEYMRFIKDLQEARADPMFLRPEIALGPKDKAPMFLDD